MFESILIEKTRLGCGVITLALISATSESIPLLSDRELKIWESDKQFRRKNIDWLSGRIAAKIAIQQLSLDIIPLNSIEILNEKTGTPFSNQPYIHFSIAHCNGYGLSAATFDTIAIGCDIEKVKDRKYLFTKYYISSEEEMLWNKHTKLISFPLYQTVLWSIKESTIKCLQKINIVPENALDIRTKPGSADNTTFKFFCGKYSGEGFWLVLGNYCMSICVLI